MKKKLFTYVFALTFLSAFSQIVPPYIPSSGLVSYWGFDGNANDYFSTNNGTVVGATLTTDRFGVVNKAYSFNGTSNRITVASSASLSNFNSITISGWFNTTAFLSNQGLVTKWFQQINCASNTDNYSCILSNNTLTNNSPAIVGATNNYTGYGLKSTFFLQTNIWYHFVFVHDNLNGGSLYINGSLTGQNNTLGTLCASTNPLIIGADNNLNTVSRFFSGKLDDIGIWNRALTSNEILLMYQQSVLTLNQQTFSNLKIYPNPVIDKMMIETDEANFNTDYKIIDQFGREVIAGEVNGKSSVVNLNNLAKGIYILKTKNDLVKPIKFIKN